MVKPLNFWTLDNDKELKNKIIALNADPYFIWFYCGWNNLINTECYCFQSEGFDASYQKKVKRDIQKEYGDNWEKEWEYQKTEGFKARNKLMITKSLFKLEEMIPLPKKNGRPRDMVFWQTIFDIKNYFVKITGEPRMRLLSDVFFPYLATNYLGAEWSRRKSWFTEAEIMESEKRVSDAERFYSTKNLIIRECLRENKPLYEKYMENKGLN